METSIKQKLANLLEATGNPKTKRAINALLEISKAGEIPEDKFVGVVSESLIKLKKEDKIVAGYFTELDNRTALDNFGLKALISTTKRTALYENDMDVKEFVDDFDEHSKNHPEYMLVDSFIPMIKRYAWNKPVGASIKVLEAKMEKFRAYKMIAEAINTLQGDKNADLYGDVIAKLDQAFSLPENQVKHYISTTLSENTELHPAISELIKNLMLLEKYRTGGYSNLSKTTYVTDRHQGRVKTQERIVPALFEDNRDVILINRTLYEIKGKAINEIKDVRKAGIPIDFVRLCEKFLNFTLEGKKLKINDEVHEYAIVLNERLSDDDIVILHDNGDKKLDSLRNAKSISDIEIAAKSAGLTVSTSEDGDWIGVAEDPKGEDIFIASTKKYADANEQAYNEPDNTGVEVDGAVQDGETQDVLADLATMGVNPDIIGLIKDMIDNAGDLALMDNIVTVCPVDKGVIIDIIKLNPDDLGVYVNILDVSAGINQLVNVDTDPGVVDQVAGDYGLDINPLVGEDIEPNPEDEEKKREKEEELQKHKDQLDEVMNNIEKIEMLDDDYKEGEEVSTLKTQLEEQKGMLMEKIKELEIELGDGEAVTDDIGTITERIYDEFKSIIEDKGYAGELTNDEDPNATVTKSGGVHQISETVSVIPVLEFEKSNGEEKKSDDEGDNGENGGEENGENDNDGSGLNLDDQSDGGVDGAGDDGMGDDKKKPKITSESIILSNAYLQVSDTSVVEGDEIGKKFEGSKYMAMEDGYVNLAVEPMDHEDELPDTIKEDISNVLNTISPVDNEGDALDESISYKNKFTEIDSGLISRIQSLPTHIEGVNVTEDGNMYMIHKDGKEIATLKDGIIHTDMDINDLQAMLME